MADAGQREEAHQRDGQEDKDERERIEQQGRTRRFQVTAPAAL
jgi:hypothetical protein